MTENRWGRARLMAVLAAAVLLFVACGADADDAESGADSAEPAATFDGDDVAFDSETGGEGEAGAPATTVPVGQGEADEGAGSTEEGDIELGDDAQQAGTGDGEAEGDEAQGELGAGGAAVTPTAADLGRKLIFTAVLRVEVDDVAAASAEATAIIESMGGFLFGQNTAGGAEPTSELTFKVLPDDFNLALERLGTVGELRNQTVTTDDVTERIVDLESRIGVAELGVARLRTELEATTSLEDFAELERLLLERESELEVMRGQLRTLQDRVDLATITLIVSQDRVENSVELAISAYEGHDEGQSCPGETGVIAESGSPVTVCFDVINTGDQTLTDIVLTDTVLDIDGDTTLIPVFGDLTELAPGQSGLVAYEFEPERRLQLRTRVTAVPTDGASAEPAGPSVSTQITFDLRTFEPERDPGFGDGFSVAVDILRGAWVAIKVVVGFVIPMLVFVPVLWAAWWALREWRRRRPARPSPPARPPAPVPGDQPPPPQPVGVGAPTTPSEPTRPEPDRPAEE